MLYKYSLLSDESLHVGKDKIVLPSCLYGINMLVYDSAVQTLEHCIYICHHPKLRITSYMKELMLNFKWAVSERCVYMCLEACVYVWFKHLCVLSAANSL